MPTTASRLRASADMATFDQAGESRLPLANTLLAALANAEYQRLLPRMESVELAFGNVLYEPGDTLAHVYFPNDCLVSLLTVVDDHLALEVGLVGWEGMVGVALALGIDACTERVVVQGAGTAARVKASAFRQMLHHCPHWQRKVLLYTHTLMFQMAQTAACNRFHLTEARLARWLLMTRDRMRSNHFHLTHEFLGNMLGTRRVSVTHAAYALKQRCLIDYARGNIDIIDAPGLEAASCSCYSTLKGPP